MTDHPINAVVLDGNDVDKAAFRSYDKTRHRLRVANVSEVTSSDYSDAYGLDLGGQLFDKDTSDTVTAHDGVNCLVDNVGTRFKLRITGVGKRAQVRAATTANITIATALNNGDTLDGVTLATNDLVLVKDQTNKAENRIIVVGASPAAPVDFDAFDDYAGSLIAVSEGTANASTLWFCSANVGGTLGTDDLDFTKIEFVGGSGDVVGPAGAIDNRIALFDGTTGKLLKDGGTLLSELAPKASPTFTGTPVVPTPGLGVNSTQAAPTIFVRNHDGSATVAKFRALGLFHPAFLFGSSDTGDCWDAFDPDTLWQLSSMATPVAATGDPVGGFVGQRASNALIQATSTKRPTFTISSGIRHLVFDGTDDVLKATFTLTQPHTRISLIKQITWATEFLIDGATTNSSSLVQISSSPNLRMYAGASGLQSTGLAVGAFGVVTEIYNGASSKFAINNGSYVTGNVGTGDPGGLTLGQDGGAVTTYANFALSAVIDIGRVLTDAEIGLVRTFYGARMSQVL